MKLWSILGNSQKLDGGAMFGNAPRALWSRWTSVDEYNRIDLACRALLASPLNGKTVLFETGIGAFFHQDRAGGVAFASRRSWSSGGEMASLVRCDKRLQTLCLSASGRVQNGEKLLCPNDLAPNTPTLLRCTKKHLMSMSRPLYSGVWCSATKAVSVPESIHQEIPHADR